jgi:hypothetical protein
MPALPVRCKRAGCVEECTAFKVLIDTAGNRTSMTDGMGGMSYQYDTLSYDNRLRLTQWNIPNVLGYRYAYNYFGENSGRVTFASNLNNGPAGRDASLDRSYDYDHVGHLLAAYSGTAALAQTGQGSTWGGDGPYAQDCYEVWSNLTHRGGWGGENASYSDSLNSNKQRVGSSYDAAGNILSYGGQRFTYDATGQQDTYARRPWVGGWSVRSTAPGRSAAQVGRLCKRTFPFRQRQNKTIYLLDGIWCRLIMRSSVFRSTQSILVAACLFPPVWLSTRFT